MIQAKPQIDSLVFLGVGNDVGVEHIAIDVGKDMIADATVLFQRLGFQVRETSDQGIVDMVKDGSISIQLIERDYRDEEEWPAKITNNHIAIRVQNADTVNRMILEWARNRGHDYYPVTMRHSIVVYLTTILSVGIELVDH